MCVASSARVVLQLQCKKRVAKVTLVTLFAGYYTRLAGRRVLPVSPTRGARKNKIRHATIHLETQTGGGGYTKTKQGLIFFPRKNCPEIPPHLFVFSLHDFWKCGVVLSFVYRAPMPPRGVAPTGWVDAFLKATNSRGKNPRLCLAACHVPLYDGLSVP